MTSKKDEDYQHANRARTGPAKRMTGGDLTDDIEINDPCAPHKKQAKKCLTQPTASSPRPREAEIKDDPGTI
ncbi:MAG: hypothetical protein AAGC78_12820 [Cellvibrio sp.]|uniref:hypothetical protein n=1 Tax=Cellvibrio sp. TaxID=1965322 RepID=UPI00319EEA65